MSPPDQVIREMPAVDADIILGNTDDPARQKQA
jgi:hypothetical protein